MADLKYGRLFTEGDVEAILEHFGAAFETREFGKVADQAIAEGFEPTFPADEPLFLLRGQDDLAQHTVQSYFNLAADNGAPASVLISAEKSADQFAEFAIAHPDRIKEPS